MVPSVAGIVDGRTEWREASRCTPWPGGCHDTQVFRRFQFVGSLTAPRQRHEATLLPDGSGAAQRRGIVERPASAGGFAFQSRDAPWSMPLTPMLVPRADHTATRRRNGRLGSGHLLVALRRDRTRRDFRFRAVTSASAFVRRLLPPARLLCANLDSILVLRSS